MDNLKVVKSVVIAFTKVDLPWGWLGNMAPFPVEYEGKVWGTTEALFQSMRYNKENIKEIIRKEVSPMGAKMKAKKYRDQYCVEPRSEEDVENMIKCIKLKLEQHPQLVTKLKNSGDYLIVEDVTERIKKGSKTSALFWGAAKDKSGNWFGENRLGKIWMDLRKEYLTKNRKSND